jgi:hypothetical protein
VKHCTSGGCRGQSGSGVVCPEGAEEGRRRRSNKSGGSRGGQPMAVAEQAWSDTAGSRKAGSEQRYGSMSASVSEGCQAVIYW